MKKIVLFYIQFLVVLFVVAQPSSYTTGNESILIKNTDINSSEIKNITYRLDSFYKQRVAKGFNGQVLVGYKGNIIYERYFGVADKENNKLMDEHSPSQLASTSKPITAIAICMLMEKGLLNFDDLVQKYISQFPYPNITIRNLLTHRSGLPEYFGLATSNLSSDSLMSNDSLIQLIINKQPKPNYKPDTKFKYRNTNYAILSYLVQIISGTSFSNFVQTNIFEPLGMNDSYIFDTNGKHKTNYCKSYKGNWNIQDSKGLDGITGDKSCYSTVQDLYKLDQALYTNKLLQPKTLEKMYSPYSFERKSYQNYGLGWRMFDYPERKIIFHNGNWHGNNNCFYRFINENFTIIILGNKLNNYIYAHPKIIYNIVANTNVELTEDIEQ